MALLENRVGEQLADLVARAGARPLRAPALAELPDLDPQQIRALVRGWREPPVRVAVFQTGVGAKALFAAADGLGLGDELNDLLAATTVVVRGPKPTGALRARGVRVDVSAAEPYTTREVLEAMAPLDLAGARVVVQRYGETNRELDAALEARGAQVTEIPTYRWSLPEDTAPLVRLLDALDEGAVDAVVFTSASQVQNLFDFAARLGRNGALAARLNRTRVASIGPVCTRALRERGVEVALEASPPKLGPLLSALEQALA